MNTTKFSRRDLMIGSSALPVGSAFSTKVMSAAPPASSITPALIEAAKKEGKVVWYTSIDLKISERIGKARRAQVGRLIERWGDDEDPRRAEGLAGRRPCARVRVRDRRQGAHLDRRCDSVHEEPSSRNGSGGSSR